MTAKMNIKNYRTYYKVLFIIILYLFCINSVLSKEIFYKSNSLAMIFDEVESNIVFSSNYEINNENEYYIGVEIGGGIERRRLFSSEEGDFVKTWEIYYYYEGVPSLELEYSYNELVSKRIYSRAGVITEEIHYNNEITTEHLFFIYNTNNRLILLNVLDEQEELVYKESYAYTESGMLREVINTDSEDNINIYSYNFGNGALIEEISKEGDYLYISRFSPNGRLYPLASSSKNRS